MSEHAAPEAPPPAVLPHGDLPRFAGEVYLLRDCLKLWGVQAAIAVQDDGIHVGAFVVQRASADMHPVRWLLHRPGRAPRMAPSIGALLTALRNAIRPEAPP